MKAKHPSLRHQVEALQKECRDLETVLASVREERQQLRQLLSLSAVEAAVATEREACALTAEEWATGWWPEAQGRLFAEGCAAAIRRRSNAQ